MSLRRRGVVTLRQHHPVPAPIEAVTAAIPLRQQLTRLLQQDIITGVYAPGQRLIERELVDRFGVSSIPVREALQDLEAQGLVVKRPNAGCTVVKLTRQDVEQIMRLINVLQPVVIGWAAESFRPEHEAALSACGSELRTVAESGSVPPFFQAALHLQKTIWSIAGNPWAARTLESTVPTVLATGLRLAIEKGFLDLKADAVKFNDLVQFIIAGDAGAAAVKMREIADGYFTSLLGLLSEGDD